MTVVDAGNFTRGDFSEFNDNSWNGQYPAPAGYNGPNRLSGAISTAGAGPNGGRYISIISDDQAVNVVEDGGGTQHQRIHMISLPSYPNPGNDGDIWAGSRSLWLDSGYTNDNYTVAADEYHVQGGGVSPLLLQWWRDSSANKPRFRFIIVGGWTGSTYRRNVQFGPLYPGQSIPAPGGSDSIVSFKDKNGTSNYVPPWEFNSYQHLRWEYKYGSSGTGSFQADAYVQTLGATTTVATPGCLSGTGLGTFTLTSAINFLTGTTITVQIGSELIAGSLSGTTFTVTIRGQADSIAATHAAGGTISAGEWVNIVPLTTGMFTGYGTAKPTPAFFLSVYSDTRGPRYTNPAPASGGTRPSAGTGLTQARYAAGFIASSYDELKTKQIERLGTLVGGTTTTGGGGGGSVPDPTIGPYGSPIIDSFVGVNADPIGGHYITNFTFAPGHQDYRLLNHTLTPSAGGAAGSAQAYHDLATYGPDAEVFYKITSVPTGTGEYWDTILRLTNPNGAYNGVEISFTRNSDGTWLVQIFKHESGSNALVGTVFPSFTLVTPQWVAHSVKGTTTTTIETWTWNGTTWNLQGAFPFNPVVSLQGAGYVGWESTRGSAFAISGWGAGTIGSTPVIPPPPAVVTAPVINGTLTLGQTLTLSSNGTYTNSPTTSVDSWWSWTSTGGNHLIAGQTGTTYVISGTLAEAYWCVVEATNGGGSIFTASNTLGVSSPTPTLPPTSTSAPVISGNLSVGSILSSTAGSWTNTPITFNYLWSRGSAPILGATASTYQLQTLDAGNPISCTVTALNAVGASTPVSSNILSIPASLALRTIATRINNPSGRLNLPANRLQTTGGGL